MITKLTPDNTVALPEEAVADFKGVERFAVTIKHGRIRLTPLYKIEEAAVDESELWENMSQAERDTYDKHLADAIAWARRAPKNRKDMLAELARIQQQRAAEK